jgi:hypothetical protein
VAADRLRRKLVQLEASIHSRIAERDVEGFRAVMLAIQEATLPLAGKESKS